MRENHWPASCRYLEYPFITPCLLHAPQLILQQCADHTRAQSRVGRLVGAASRTRRRTRARAHRVVHTCMRARVHARVLRVFDGPRTPARSSALPRQDPGELSARHAALEQKSRHRRAVHHAPGSSREAPAMASRMRRSARHGVLLRRHCCRRLRWRRRRAPSTGLAENARLSGRYHIQPACGGKGVLVDSAALDRVASSPTFTPAALSDVMNRWYA
jgi:hypothetical protein